MRLNVWARRLPFFIACAIGMSAANASTPDGIQSWTSGSSDFVFQSIEVSRHFFKQNDLGASYFATDEAKEYLDESHEELVRLPLYWNLGIGYGYANTPANGINPSLGDSVGTGSFGLGWDPLQDLSLNTRLNYASIPNEQYQSGSVLFKIEYTFSLSSIIPKKVPFSVYEDDGDEKKEDSERNDDEVDSSRYDLEDARQFYRYKRQKNRELAADAEDTTEDEVDYPRIRVAYQFEGTHHQVGSKVFQLPSNSGLTSQSLDLFQYVNGFDLAYIMNTRWTFGGYVGFYHYSGPTVDNFLSQIESGTLQQALMSNMAWNGFASSTLTMPSNILKAYVNWKTNDKSHIDLTLMKVSYSASNQIATYSVTPMYSRLFSQHWQGGVGFQATVDHVAWPFMAGILQLSYAF